MLWNRKDPKDSAQEKDCSVHQMLIEHGMIVFDVFSIYAQRPLFLETTSSSSNNLNDNLFPAVRVYRYIYIYIWKINMSNG